MTTEDDVRASILEFAAVHGMQGVNRGVPVADGFDLRLDGGLDSLGFMQLIAHLEQAGGGPIDLADLDPEQLTRLGPLASHIAGQLEERHARP